MIASYLRGIEFSPVQIEDIMLLLEKTTSTEFYNWFKERVMTLDKKNLIENVKLLKEDLIQDRMVKREDIEELENIMTRKNDRKHLKDSVEQFVDDWTEQIKNVLLYHQDKFKTKDFDVSEYIDNFKKIRKSLVNYLMKNPDKFIGFKQQQEKHLIARMMLDADDKQLNIFGKTLEIVIPVLEDLGISPRFMGTQYLPKKSKKIKPGKVVIARSLDGLPANITERVPELKDSPHGYMIKRYRTNTMEEKYINITDVYKTSKGPMSLPDIAALLQKNQRIIKNFFEKSDKHNKGIPDMVVPSSYFVARDNDGQFTLFEIQKRLVEFYSLPSCHAREFDHLSSEKIEMLVDTLKTLRMKLVVLRDKNTGHELEQYFPDLGVQNIAVTTDGQIKLFDTNICTHGRATHKSSLWEEQVTYTAKIVEDFVDELEHVLHHRRRAKIRKIAG